MGRADLDALGPVDGAVALRSFPRRYREAFTGDDELREDAAAAVGTGGESPFELAVQTVRSLSLLERAIEQVETTENPILHGGVLDPAERQFDLGAHGDLGQVLDELATEAPAFADRVEGLHGDAWGRTGSLPSGESVTALDLLREAVRTGADNLRAIERLLGDR